MFNIRCWDKWYIPPKYYMFGFGLWKADYEKSITYMLINKFKQSITIRGFSKLQLVNKLLFSHSGYLPERIRRIRR